MFQMLIDERNSNRTSILKLKSYSFPTLISTFGALPCAVPVPGAPGALCPWGWL